MKMMMITMMITKSLDKTSAQKAWRDSHGVGLAP